MIAAGNGRVRKPTVHVSTVIGEDGIGKAVNGIGETGRIGKAVNGSVLKTKAAARIRIHKVV